MSACIITRFATVTLSRAGIDSLVTPGPAVLEKFGQVLEAAGIRGQLLPITDNRGVQHKRGPSKWQQRRHQLERNLADNTAKGNTAGAAKWMQLLLLHEQTDFGFDFSASGPIGTGTSSPVISGGVTGAAEGCAARGAPVGAAADSASMPGGSVYHEQQAVHASCLMPRASWVPRALCLITTVPPASCPVPRAPCPVPTAYWRPSSLLPTAYCPMPPAK